MFLQVDDFHLILKCLLRIINPLFSVGCKFKKMIFSFYFIKKKKKKNVNLDLDVTEMSSLKKI
jgi:hypothetical protein